MRSPLAWCRGETGAGVLLILALALIALSQGWPLFAYNGRLLGP